LAPSLAPAARKGSSESTSISGVILTNSMVEHPNSSRCADELQGIHI